MAKKAGDDNFADRRDDLADQAATVFLTQGLCDLSLRRIATELGTSHRMLLYYFESREDLIATALGRISSTYRVQLAEALGPAAGARAKIRALWDFLGAPDRAGYVRLQLEAWGRSLNDPDTYRDFLLTGTGMRSLIETALTDEDVAEATMAPLATLAEASICGLLLDRFAGLDPAELDASFETLLNMLPAAR